MKNVWAVLLVLLVPCTLGAGDNGQKRVEWMLLGGLGQSHPGWGDTEERVKTVDLVLRRSVTLLSTDWDRYNVYHSFLVELPVHIVTEPDTNSMFGLNFLACWTCQVSDRFAPYLFLGGGPVYTEADIPGMGANFNWNYQAGIGLRFQEKDGRALVLEYRFHHISNGDRVDPNIPLNSTKVLVGISLTF